MVILIDANVLLRAVSPGHADHSFAVAAILRLRRDGHQPVIVPQCAYEYYVVATRPIANNGLGMNPVDAIKDLDEFLGLYRLLRDERLTFESWVELIGKYSVRGKTAHDARLVASMLRHRVTDLLTFNVADFRRYAADIRVHAPREFV